jgi:hypothetical protein
VARTPTSLVHSLGLHAVEYWYSKRMCLSPKRISPLAELIMPAPIYSHRINGVSWSIPQNMGNVERLQHFFVVPCLKQE